MTIDLTAALPLPFVAAAAALGATAIGAVVLVRGRARRGRIRRLRVDEPMAAPAAADGATHRPSAARAVIDWAAERAAGVTREADPDQIRQLRLQLIRAGLFDPRGPALFFLARFVLAAAGGAGTGLWLFLSGTLATHWMWPLFAGGLCYFLPTVWLSRRAQRVLDENRRGFPDFLDLMGVCANAGLSMEAGLERVSRELADLYPTLGMHLQTLCLEVRAGRPIEEALNGLGHRLNVPEVRSFATLLQQSKELGSSLSDALRVFAEDMRHKRLSMAEEKAYALPAKLSVPVTVCILPVVIFVAVLPVIVRYKTGIQ